ncbi:MAG: DNA-3-methyladenine glycosylase I [Desulfatibacillaceae bacterium]|nr:DNA-3-methyladenine glycosylase I [Desulfatibacillaceae bacterium]
MTGPLPPYLTRCPWAVTDPLYMDYHDHEWGVALHDDVRLFELLVLEGAQAGLSWLTILRKRPCYRQLFDGFEPAAVACFGPEKVEELLENPGIIRNRKKIEAAIQNARAFLKVQEGFGSFDAYLWRFVGGKPVQNAWKEMAQVPASTKTSQELAKDLKQRGFAFVGPTICYAYMQSAGLVNDHLVSCFCHARLSA